MTPDQWRDSLSDTLRHRRAAVLQARALYDGPHQWPTPPTAIRQRMERLCALAETNICSLIVDAVSDRLEIDGIRLSPGSDDDTVWREVWQANHLDVDSIIAHEEMLKSGRSFLLASEVADAPARLTVEDPMECIVAYRPGERRDRVAALKTFIEGDEAVATLWTPESVITWRSSATRSTEPGAWRLDQSASGDHPFGKVPMVELRCKPRMDPNSTSSELPNSIIVIQQRINLTMLQLLLASGLMVVPQRYLIGADLPKDADGNLVNSLEAGADRVWIVEADDPSKVQLGQLAPADINKIADLIEADIQRAAAISRTPLYYLNGGLINISADTIRAAADGHLAKVKARRKAVSEPWEEGINLVQLANGQPEVPDMEIHWADAETRSLAEKADAGLKLFSIGYPFAAIARKMGESQAEIARLMVERAEEGQAMAAEGARVAPQEIPVPPPA